jgi:hypothetical protein
MERLILQQDYEMMLEVILDLKINVTTVEKIKLD